MSSLGTFISNDRCDSHSNHCDSRVIHLQNNNDLNVTNAVLIENIRSLIVQLYRAEVGD